MVWLSEEQKRVVRRYATVGQLWRKADRSFASLEYDMAAGYAVLADGIAVDNRPGGPVITSDANDPKFVAAIFGNDDRAVPDLTATELKQLRHYIIYLKGGLPIRHPSEPKAGLVARPRKRASRLIAAVIRRARAEPR